MLMTMDQVCEEYGFTPEILRDLRRAPGKRHLKSVKLGHRTVRFRRSDIEEWISNNTR